MKKINIKSIIAVIVLIIAAGLAVFFSVLIKSGSISKPNTGFIEGSLTFPSDFIPDDLTVYAENVNVKKIFKTNIHIEDNKYIYGIGYRLQVPPGEYFVYSAKEGHGYLYYFNLERTVIISGETVAGRDLIREYKKEDINKLRICVNKNFPLNDYLLKKPIRKVVKTGDKP